MDDGHFPGFKSSGQLYDIGIMPMFQEACGDRRPVSAGAIDDDRVMAWNFRETGGQMLQGKVLALIDVTGFPFLRGSDIDQVGTLTFGELLLQCDDRYVIRVPAEFGS